MKVVFKGGKPRPSLEQIKAVEEKLGVQFPDDYRVFLLTDNGGSPDPYAFDFTGVDGYENSSAVRKFLSIHAGQDDNLELKCLYYWGNERIPNDVAPIAYDPGGNLICISLSGQRRGAIFFWDHELELERAGSENLALLSSSFSQFLSGLHEEKE